MVEVLTLVAIIIVIRAVYLWRVRGAEDAKVFVEQSTGEINKAMGWGAKVFLIILALFVLLVIALAA